MSPVSVAHSTLVYDALKACGIRLMSALPETWLVHLIRMAEDDPEMTLVRLAKEEEGVGISAGAHLAGVKSAMLMQNHGFLASINGIVSCAQLYRIPLLMLISYRGEFGERDPWQTEGGGVTEDLLRALRIPFTYLDHPDHVARRIAQGADARALGEQAGRAAAVPRPDVGGRMMRRLDALKADLSASSRTRSSSRSWARSRPSCSRSAIGRTSSTCSTRWAWPRRWGSASRSRSPSCQVVVLRRRRVDPHEPRRPDDAGALPAANLVHVVFDNESLLSVGGFPTATSTGSDLAGIAAAAGVPRTATVRDARRVHAARSTKRCAASELTTIVAKVEAVGPSGYVTDLSLLENRFQFQRYLRVGTDRHEHVLTQLVAELARRHAARRRSDAAARPGRRRSSACRRSSRRRRA